MFYSTLLLENGYGVAKCDLTTFQNQQGIIVSPTLNPNNFPFFTLEIRLQEVFTEIKDKTEYNVPQGIKRVLTLEVENNIQNIDTIIKGNFHC